MRFARLDSDFVGRQATVEGLVGPLRRRCAYLAVETKNSDCHGSEAVFMNGTLVGAVSTAGYGHCLGRSLPFANLTPEHAEPGTELELMVLGERRPARVLGKALYDPENARPRG